MGAPWHTMKHLQKEVGMVAVSANLVLYGDMSNLMMQLAAGFGGQQ